MSRPPIPAELKRQVLVEAGHRCAIPTCRQPVTEVAHIIPYAKVREHRYENLIALCPNCHARADKGEIDKASLRIYKRILQRLTDKYLRFELIVLNELRTKERIPLAGNMTLLIKNLIDEGLVELEREGVFAGDYPINVFVSLTGEGQQFIDEWVSANERLTY